jgi:hypothetical protein
VAALQEVAIYNKDMPEQRETLKGRTEGPWVIVNRGPHLKWGLFDRATGMRLAHAAPTLQAVRNLIAEIDAAGLELEVSSKWAYEHGPQWGDSKSYTSESIRALGRIVAPHSGAWTGRVAA